MPDARTLLDSYAQGISGLSTTEDAAPEAIVALRAVLAAVDTWRDEAWEPAGKGDYTTGYVAGALAATFAHEDKIRRVIAEKLGGDEQ